MRQPVDQTGSVCARTQEARRKKMIAFRNQCISCVPQFVRETWNNPSLQRLYHTQRGNLPDYWGAVVWHGSPRTQKMFSLCPTCLPFAAHSRFAGIWCSSKLPTCRAVTPSALRRVTSQKYTQRTRNGNVSAASLYVCVPTVTVVTRRPPISLMEQHLRVRASSGRIRCHQQLRAAVSAKKLKNSTRLVPEVFSGAAVLKRWRLENRYIHKVLDA